MAYLALKVATASVVLTKWEKPKAKENKRNKWGEGEKKTYKGMGFLGKKRVLGEERELGTRKALDWSLREKKWSRESKSKGTKWYL